MAAMAAEHLIVYGGSFDPVHVGHLIPALRAREILAADRVLFLPANRSPFKMKQHPGASGPQRLEMLRLAMVGVAGCAADERELHRAGPSYTVETLRELHAERPGVRLTLLLGADQLQMLHGWKGIGEILDMAAVAILPRMTGMAADFSSVRRHLGDATAKRLEAGLLATPLVGISATEVRARVRAGLSVRFWVPEGVAGFIAREGLYG